MDLSVVLLVILVQRRNRVVVHLASWRLYLHFVYIFCYLVLAILILRRFASDFGPLEWLESVF